MRASGGGCERDVAQVKAVLGGPQRRSQAYRDVMRVMLGVPGGGLEGRADAARVFRERGECLPGCRRPPAPHRLVSTPGRICICMCQPHDSLSRFIQLPAGRCCASCAVLEKGTFADVSRCTSRQVGGMTWCGVAPVASLWPDDVQVRGPRGLHGSRGCVAGRRLWRCGAAKLHRSAHAPAVPPSPGRLC